MMRRACSAAVLLAVALPASAGFEASVDLRLVESDGRNSYLDGGFGKLRFDDQDDGLQLGRLRLAWHGGIGGDWYATVDASAWHPDDDPVIDLTEAYAEWRPVPQSAWRSNLKVGAFYAPISLEHRAPGWTNPYTISSSALNTWVGEELRTIGVAYELEHLGTAEGGRFDYGVQAAVYGWNDPAGVEVALRGWSLNDRQTTLFGRIGTYAYGGPEQRVIFSEIDNRPGYYVSGYVRTDNGLELRAVHYDNRGDPTAYKESIEDYAWDTHFDSAGLRYDGSRGTTFIAQWLGGKTSAGDDPLMKWNFDTYFALLAQSIGKHRFAARYDEFHVQQTQTYPFAPLGSEHGNAWTLGWTWAVHEHVELATEWLRIDSYHSGRRAIGEDPDAVEHLLQFAVRVSL
jgi:hypothetical protein